MAIADNRQRIMPMPDDRGEGRSEKLGYPEAVRLTDPINATLRGEVNRGLHLNASIYAVHRVIMQHLNLPNNCIGG